MTIDLGQGQELEEVRDRALADRRRARARPRRARGVRPRLHRPRAEGRRALRGPVRRWRRRSAGR